MAYLEPTERDLPAARHRAGPVEASPVGVATEPPTPPNGRAGRNLPVAIAVGASLGAVVLASLLFWRPAFLAVIAVGAVVAIWEMVRAVAQEDGPRAPLVPLLAGCLVMIGLAWYAGAEALLLGLVLTVLAAMVWRLADGPAGYQRDLLATILIAVYVPLSP